MARFLARRLAGLVVVLVVVGTVVFTLIHLTPGDPAAIIAGPGAAPAQVAALHTRLGLDAPLTAQFVHWFAAVASGDLGTSLYFGQPVGATLLAHAGPTLSLTAIAYSLTLLVAIPAGIAAATSRNAWTDRAFLSVSLLGVSIPSFWLALVAIVFFAVHLRWFPVAGYVPPARGAWPWLHALILPASVLAVGQIGIIARLLRDGVREVLQTPYIQTARAKGLTPGRVLLRHAVPNALIPAVTVMGTSVAALLGGAVVTETVFTIPGIGQLVVDSIARRDYPVVQGAVLCIALTYVAVNACVDVAYAWLDPRIRYE